MSGRRKYALHAGHVISKHDGEQHFIGVGQLARLYELAPTEYVIWDDRNSRRYGLKWDDYIHLYPSYEGNYGRPKE